MSDQVFCAHCGEAIERDASGRWAHSYDVRGHMGPWFYCQKPRTTRATPTTTPTPPVRDERKSDG